ncbi:uncharacterized protein LOC110036697 isoform X2 [Phalaenopsis equestris]|uniref:uncharacterized protein LOC110036697 isoform X2 n=1 Tax=Phalaenopsis equestris TaxID=78828 RepID=UPI0009E51C1D|nr:uncharacterized protein LOC110036697 isoform X2 [Phalaenopsis equestris]
MRCSDDGQNWLPFGVLIKPQSKYCSNVTQQYEASMATKMAKLCSRIYRTKVVEAIKALKNALPYSETVLSQTRLTGEPSAHSFVHIETFMCQKATLSSSSSVSRLTKGMRCQDSVLSNKIEGCVHITTDRHSEKS